MAQVVIDRFKGMPRVCIMTGETEDVSFERTTLKSNDEVQILKLLVMSLVTAPLGTYWRPKRGTETFELSLPFTPRGLHLYQRGRTILKACLAGAILSLLGMLAFMAVVLPEHPAYTEMLLVLGGGIVAVGAFFFIAWRTSHTVPRVLSWDERRIGLDLPSAAAAVAVQEAIAAKKAERDAALAEKRARKNAARASETDAADEAGEDEEDEREVAAAKTVKKLQPLAVSKRKRRPV